MILENPIPPFLEWIGPAVLNWLMAVVALSLLACVISLVILFIYKGVKRGSQGLASGIAEAWKELFHFSWKRCFAMALLAIRESIPVSYTHLTLPTICSV